LKTADLDYALPQDLIAQTPIEPRDAARLLVLDRAGGTLAHRHFREVGDYLRRGDVLVFNDTRVLHAHLSAVKIPTGGRVEVLLLKRLDEVTWETLVRGAGVRRGTRLRLAPAAGQTGLEVTAEIVAALDLGGRVLKFDRPIEAHLDTLGSVPLPPYIHQPLRDPERYQTVYARVAGSAAAPTAGLHFTPGLMQSLRDQGVDMAFVELRVGLDTFRPIDEDEVEQHRIHAEHCCLGAEVAGQIEHARRLGGRVIAVGTTSVRTLETAAQQGSDRRVLPFQGDTRLFITPGFEFRAVDAMITNFHLPRSTLLALVAAFAGRDTILQAYRTAIAERYRLFSFGDAMLIL
jgi:S-adenosylmethionine:tRNA ribosyltransferase-isomerase